MGQVVTLPHEDVQKATFRVVEDALDDLEDPDVPIRDEVQDGDEPPFVVFGSHEWESADTKTGQGWEGGVGIHLFSDYSGNAELVELMETVASALAGGDLNPDHWTAIHQGFDRADIRKRRDENGNLLFREGTLRQRLKCLPD